jgi:hypothetical protein
MSKLLHVALMGAAAMLTVGGAAPRPEAAPVVAPVVREVADPYLRDVAVAVYDSAKSVIYYNPVVLQRFSPDLQAFFMAHERAHIALRHTRASALRAEAGQRDSLLQLKELEADCLAAQTLEPGHHAAAMAAVHFFSRLGSRHFDNEHPPGTRRAARILACLP